MAKKPPPSVQLTPYGLSQILGINEEDYIFEATYYPTEKALVAIKATSDDLVKMLTITAKDAAEMTNTSTETHWFRVICELTRDLRPYTVVTIEAMPR